MSKRKQLEAKMGDNTAKTNFLFNLLSKLSLATYITKERVIVRDRPLLYMTSRKQMTYSVRATI